MKYNRLHTLIVAALGVAAIFAVTALFPRIPLVVGYAHLGDLLVFLFACLLPTPYAMAAAGLGAAAADLATGFGEYAPFTLVIKALISLCFTAKREKFLCRRNYLALGFAVPITVVGYYIPEVFFLGGLVPPLANVPFNALQVVVCGICFVAIALLFDRWNFKSKLGMRGD